MRALAMLAVLLGAGIARAGEYDSPRVVELDQASGTCASVETAAKGVVEQLDREGWANVSEAMAGHVDVVRRQVETISNACATLASSVTSLRARDFDIAACEKCYGDDGTFCSVAPTHAECERIAEEADQVYATGVAAIHLYEDAASLIDATAKTMNELKVTTDDAARAAVVDEREQKCGDGDGEACLQLGDAFNKGDHRPKSAKKAKQLWKKAVKLLDRECVKKHVANSCQWLAEMCGDGDVATGKSAKKAKRYRALFEKYRPVDKLEDMFGR